jgi:hypothetical protein
MIGVFAGVDAVGFADDQCFGPRTRIAFSFQRFDQAQKAVFEFECLVIENFEIVLGKLVCLEVSVVAGNTLSELLIPPILVLSLHYSITPLLQSSSTPSLQYSNTPFPFLSTVNTVASVRAFSSFGSFSCRTGWDGK